MTVQNSTKYIALLRGINVGGHHKVPMERLRSELEKLGYSRIVTLLNSGNVVFEAHATADLETQIEKHLQHVFGFPIPVLLRDFEGILAIAKSNPFENIEVTGNTRLYVSFLKTATKRDLTLPHLSQDGSFQIIAVKNNTIFSVLDISKGKTVKGMDELEQLFGKEITTRNWNTIMKLANK